MATRPSAIKRILRRYRPLIQSRGRVLKRFAHKIGLVYFGTIDRHDADHQLVRGLTASITHVDTHYAVGSYDGYDVSLVDRVDIVQNKEYTWAILQIDLKHDRVPHVFLKPRGNDKQYHAHAFASRYLMEISGLFTHSHRPDYLQRYETYAKSTNAQLIEDVLTADVTHVLAVRFWPHAVEVWDGKLYVYITEHRLSEAVLGAAVESALWLAETLDNQTD